jgi:hypothetical protein
MAIGGIIAYQNIKIENKYIINGISIISITAIMITVWLIN